MGRTRLEIKTINYSCFAFVKLSPNKIFIIFSSYTASSLFEILLQCKVYLGTDFPSLRFLVFMFLSVCSFECHQFTDTKTQRRDFLSIVSLSFVRVWRKAYGITFRVNQKDSDNPLLFRNNRTKGKNTNKWIIKWLSSRKFVSLFFSGRNLSAAAKLTEDSPFYNGEACVKVLLQGSDAFAYQQRQRNSNVSLLGKLILMFSDYRQARERDKMTQDEQEVVLFVQDTKQIVDMFRK